MIGLVYPLLPPAPTTNIVLTVSDGVVSGMRTLFSSPVHNLDPVASENQPFAVSGSLRWINIWDRYMFPGNFLPTPPLIQNFTLSEK